VSALVKRYVKESGSASVSALLKSERCATSRLSEVEVVSALVRRGREGAFTTAQRDRPLASFRDDLLALVVVELTLEITQQACNLLLRHQLRAADAIQLSSCLYLEHELKEAISFTAFDDKLNLAARGEGLKVIS
jgi:uncharacterized protein